MIDNLFYYTGAFWWSITFMFTACFLGRLIYECLGAGIMVFRIRQAWNRAKSEHTWKQAKVLFVIYLDEQYPHTWIKVKGTDEKVYYPRPWRKKKSVRSFPARGQIDKRNGSVDNVHRAVLD